MADFSDLPGNRLWSDIFADFAEAYVDKESAAQILEDTKSVILADMVLKLIDGNEKIAVNKAEKIARASPEWKRHLGLTNEAKKAALKAKLDLEVIRMKFAEWNSAEANRRSEMRM